MAIPRIITITGTALGVDGLPVPGVRVSFSPDTTLVRETATNDVMIPEAVTDVSGADGELSLPVPATDDPAFTPTGWTWTMTITYPGNPVPYSDSVAIPYASAGATLKLSELVPTPADAGSVLYATLMQLQAYLPLTGGTIAGNLAISDVTNAKSYRFRTTGGGLDNEAAGANWIISVWSGANYTGTQRTYLRLENGTQLAHMVGRWIGAVDPDTNTYTFDMDPTAGTVTTGRKNALEGIVWAGRKDTAGAPTTGTWALHDVVMSTTGIHRCTAAGTPGTWVTL